MFKIVRADNLFGPFKRMSSLRIGGNEIVNCLTQVSKRVHAQAFESLTPQDAKPNFNLIQPGGMGRSVMKMHVGVLGQPAVMLRFMGIKVIENDVKLYFRVLRYHLIHEVQKFPSAAARIMPYFYHTCSNFKGSEKSRSAMTLVFMTKSPQSLPVRKAKPSLSALKRLNSWFLVNTDDNGILWRIQVKANYISSLLSELGVSADTPTASSLQMNNMLPQHSPDKLGRNISQLSRNQRPGPTRISRRRISVQQSEYPAFRLAVVSWLLTGTRRILKGSQALLHEPLTSSYHHGPRQPNLRCYRLIGHPFSGQQYNPRPLHSPYLSRSRSKRCFQAPSFFFTDNNYRKWFAHAT